MCSRKAIHDQVMRTSRSGRKDPNCAERDLCAKVLAERRTQAETFRLKEEQRLIDRRARLQENTFYPRTEVFADARHPHTLACNTDEMPKGDLNESASECFKD